MKQTISAACAVQMSEALKRGPRTLEELAAQVGLKQTTVGRWIAHMQMFDRVRTGLGPWYRWVAATDQQIAEFAAAYATAKGSAV